MLSAKWTTERASGSLLQRIQAEAGGLPRVLSTFLARSRPNGRTRPPYRSADAQPVIRLGVQRGSLAEAIVRGRHRLSVSSLLRESCVPRNPHGNKDTFLQTL